MWDFLITFNSSDLIKSLNVRREAAVNTQDTLIDYLYTQIQTDRHSACKTVIG